MNIKEKLNAAQWAAVETTEGPLLVIAGAGSGKTRVIEYRVLHLIDRGVSPEEILLLTFTKKAAREMLERAASHDGRAAYVQGGTFHSFAYGVLRKHGRRLGLSAQVTVLDDGDSVEAVGRAMARLGFGGKGDDHFPKKATVGRILSAARNRAVSVADVLDDEYPHFADYAGKLEAVGEEYSRYKKEFGYLDYDDLLVMTSELLRDDEARELVAGKYRYIMVDEYQDTNPAQGAITELLGRKHKNVMVVGDDAQSIYRFRGASHENIMRFPEMFSGCRIVKLEENYRSVQPILDLGNAILADMPEKFAKTLRATRSGGSKPRLVYFENAEAEAEYVVGEVLDARQRGGKYADQAVLFRSSFVSIPLQAALARAGVPFRVYGGMKFYEMAHVKDVLAFLRIVANPKDEISWNRVLTLLPGVGERTAANAYAAFNENRESRIENREIEKTVTLVKGLAEEKPGDSFRKILDYYRPFLREKFDDWPSRLADLEVLAEIAETYKSIRDLLTDLALETPERAERGEGDTLTLSTIHSAKGLEWRSVYLLGAEDGVLPSKMARKEEEIEEEERLLYVAVTRAKDELALLFHLEGRESGALPFNRLSRFLTEDGVSRLLDHRDVSGIGLAERIKKENDEDGLETEDFVDY
ncbi:ATP-dependent helicase [Patescibacteria group bacterium]|nr:ATP-dependent helicase [Patescibacteria group bacterium]